MDSHRPFICSAGTTWLRSQPMRQCKVMVSSNIGSHKSHVTLWIWPKYSVLSINTHNCKQAPLPRTHRTAATYWTAATSRTVTTLTITTVASTGTATRHAALKYVPWGGTFYVPERSFMHLTVSCWFLISSGWGEGGGEQCGYVT